MARDRQRAKQRQAERRERRLAQQGRSGDDVGQPRTADVPPVEDPRVPEPAPGIDAEVLVGAPPEDAGRSDAALADEPALEPEMELAEDAAEDDEAYAPKGRRGAEEAAAHARDRPRVIQFLVFVWAELQRVQWPDRQALTTLTGVVLGFVLLAGGYLGLLDAIVSKLIQALL